MGLALWQINGLEAGLPQLSSTGVLDGTMYALTCIQTTITWATSFLGFGSLVYCRGSLVYCKGLLVYCKVTLVVLVLGAHCSLTQMAAR